jgi:hypothetical protein
LGAAIFKAAAPDFGGEGSRTWPLLLPQKPDIYLPTDVMENTNIPHILRHSRTMERNTIRSLLTPRRFSPAPHHAIFHHHNPTKTTPTKKKNVYNQLLQHTTTKNFALTSTGNNYVVFKMTS